MNKWGEEGGREDSGGSEGRGRGNGLTFHPGWQFWDVGPERLHFSLTKLTKILYDMDYFVCFSMRTLETSHEICNDSQMYNTTHLRMANVFQI